MIKKVVLLFSVIVLLILFYIYYNYNTFDSLPNKECIIEYLKQKYGNDYIILDEYLGKSGASGRHDDYLIVEVDDIEFKVSALNKEIKEDTYLQEKTNKMLSEFIQSQCRKKVTSTLDYLVKCSSFVIDESEYKEYTSCLDILQDSNLNISILLCTFWDEPIGGIYQELYELYLFLSNYRVDDITIRVDSTANKSAYLNYIKQRQNSTFYEYDELWLGEPPVSYEKFVDSIKKY